MKPSARFKFNKLAEMCVTAVCVVVCVMSGAHAQELMPPYGNMWGNGYWGGMQSCGYPSRGGVSRGLSLAERLEATDAAIASLQEGLSLRSQHIESVLKNDLEDFVIEFLDLDPKDKVLCEKFYDNKLTENTAGTTVSQISSESGRSPAQVDSIKNKTPLNTAVQKAVDELAKQPIRQSVQQTAPNQTQSTPSQTASMATGNHAQQSAPTAPVSLPFTRTDWLKICKREKIDLSICSDSKFTEKQTDRLEKMRAKSNCEISLRTYADIKKKLYDQEKLRGKLEQQRAELELKAMDRGTRGLGQTSTEAGYCWDCEQRAAGPTKTQVIGGLALGGAAILTNYLANRHDSNNLAKLGWGHQSSMIQPLAMMGYAAPFITGGIYGAIGGMGPGAFGCSPTLAGGGVWNGPNGMMSPYGLSGGLYGNVGGPLGYPGGGGYPGVFPPFAGGSIYMPGMSPWGGFNGPMGIPGWGGGIAGGIGMPGGYLGMPGGYLGMPGGFPGYGGFPGGGGMGGFPWGLPGWGGGIAGGGGMIGMPGGFPGMGGGFPAGFPGGMSGGFPGMGGGMGMGLPNLGGMPGMGYGFQQQLMQQQFMMQQFQMDAQRRMAANQSAQYQNSHRLYSEVNSLLYQIQTMNMGSGGFGGGFLGGGGIGGYPGGVLGVGGAFGSGFGAGFGATFGGGIGGFGGGYVGGFGGVMGGGFNPYNNPYMYNPYLPTAFPGGPLPTR